MADTEHVAMQLQSQHHITNCAHSCHFQLVRPSTLWFIFKPTLFKLQLPQHHITYINLLLEDCKIFCSARLLSCRFEVHWKEARATNITWHCYNASQSHKFSFLKRIGDNFLEQHRNFLETPLAKKNISKKS